MIKAKASSRWLPLLTVALATGCAPAYHSYPGCYVDCGYCPPPPLAHTHFEQCACHSCAAKPYLSSNAAQYYIPEDGDAHERAD